MSALLTENIGGVLLITFNRPKKKNAFNIEAWHAMRETFIAARSDDSVKCILMTGAGGNFSAGVDLSDFAEGDEEHPFDSAARAVLGFDKPLLAAADGVAVGGGATILFLCDVLYVGDNLRMRLPFVNLGLVPEFASSYMLQANIGARRAAELFYTAEWIDQQKAVDTGIATAAYSSDELLDRALAKAAEIAKWPVNSLRETKKCVKVAHQEGIERALEAEKQGMAKQAGSAENIEAITAFLEKREPRF